MNVEILEAELLCRKQYLLGEGAIWHPEWSKFLCVDIEGKRLIQVNIEETTREPHVQEHRLEKRIGMVVPASNGNLILALQGSIEEYDVNTGTLKKLANIEPNKPNNRCNDGKCDAAGRLWVGTMHVEAKEREGALYRFDGQVASPVLKERNVSNGICWSADNGTMYYIDSFDYNIKAYDFELDSGTISKERVVVEIREKEATPDGMCIDEEGMLWVAIWGGSSVNRYNPATGKLIGTVKVPAPHVTSCALGGQDMRELFITTARSGLSQQQLEEYPLSGSLFKARVAARGQKAHTFRL